MLGRYSLVLKLKRLQREIDSFLVEQDFHEKMSASDLALEAAEKFVNGFKKALSTVGETAKNVFDNTVHYGDKALTKISQMWSESKIIERTIERGKSIRIYITNSFENLKNYVSKTYDEILIKVGLREPTPPTLLERFKTQITRFYEVIKNFITTNPYLAGAIIIFLFLFVFALSVSKRSFTDFTNIWETFKDSVSKVWKSVRDSWQEPGLSGKFLAVVKALFSPINMLIEFLSAYDDSAQITSLGALCVTFVLLGYAYYQGVGSLGA